MTDGVVFDRPEDFDRMARAVVAVEHEKGIPKRHAGPDQEKGATTVVVRITGPSVRFTTTTTTSGLPTTTTTTTTTPAGTTTTTTTTPSKGEVYWPGKFVHRYFAYDGTEKWYDGDDCWVSPVNFGDDLEIGRQYEGYLAGYAADSYPVVVVNSCCRTTTSTTTTSGGCTGSCHWVYDFGTDNRWEKVSSDCQEGCSCFAPDICPPPGSSAFSLATGCGKFPADAVPIFCFSTSTTTTSASCLPAGCNGTCKWICHPARGWQLQESTCPMFCPCPLPQSPCVDNCDVVTNNCFVNAYCQGSCRWVWIDYPGIATPYWDFVEGGCSFNNVDNCSCDPPASPGNACGQEALTGCYVHNQDCSVCPCITTSTTTPSGPPPDPCAFTCWMQAMPDLSGWFPIASCPGCGCAYPPFLPQFAYELVQTPCVQGTTSTTTSTTSTTTTPSCSGFCKWTCTEFAGSPNTYAWVLSNNGCNSPFPCRCGPLDVIDVCGSGNVGEIEDSNCISSNPFTTSTTTTPAGGTCTWVCSGTIWIVGVDNCAGGYICSGSPGGSCTEPDSAEGTCIEAP